ncbi:hypothetical protein ACHAXR_000410, partial [Thalassiosira sp. AJA248-18]
MVALIEERDSISNGGNGHHYGSIAETNLYLNGGANNTERKPLVLDNNNDGEACPNATPPQNNPIFLEDAELLQDEIAGMTKLAIPVIMTYMLEMLPGIVTIILVGRVEYDDDNDEEGLTTSMQKLHLDAASLAVMFTNVVALSPAF